MNSRCRNLLMLFCTAILLVSCRVREKPKPIEEVISSSLAPTLTAMAVYTSGITLPTATLVPTATTQPTVNPFSLNLASPQAESAGVRRTPTQGPIEKWYGIPIMPGAKGAGPVSGMYQYTVVAQMEAVKAFYDAELHKSGWSPAEGDESDSGRLLLSYKKDHRTVEISLTPAGGWTSVIIGVLEE